MSSAGYGCWVQRAMEEANMHMDYVYAGSNFDLGHWIALGSMAERS